MGGQEPLTDETKVTSAVWRDLKIAAMDPKKEEEKWWQNAANNDREMCKRLIAAQKEQGNMLPLKDKFYREKDVVYKDAMKRAKKMENLFRDDLKI